MAEALKNTLKVLRAMHDLTQADLGAKAGVTRKSVNAIETGRMVPSVLLALKLARALAVPVETIFSLDGEAAASAGQHETGMEET
ncbi:MAG TPA: helix-turn-helix transcriptional regulator [Thermoanaerobaculia bacterium]